MAKDDIVRPGDLLQALGLLTRLPVRVDPTVAAARGARAGWAWPLAGGVVALGAGLVAQAALWLGLTAPIAAGLLLAVQAILTGAMHEDGLADSADGLWGGWDRPRRLEIMQDSRIGTFGVLALVLTIGLRWQALVVLAGVGPLWPAVLALALLSRVPMLALMRLPPARPSGLSARVGRPQWPTLWLAGAIALAGSAALIGFALLPVACTIGLVSLIWAAIARAKIGGQTGDILGASQQLSEVAGLLTLVALHA